jgi:hypothetical protein
MGLVFAQKILYPDRFYQKKRQIKLSTEFPHP